MLSTPNKVMMVMSKFTPFFIVTFVHTLIHFFAKEFMDGSSDDNATSDDGQKLMQDFPSGVGSN